MPLRVAIDLTALEREVARSATELVPSRFATALIQASPAVEFVVLTRPGTHATLSHLDAANARRVAIGEPGQLRSRWTRFERRLGRTRVGNRLGWASRLRPILSQWRPGVLRRLGVSVVLWPFTDSGLSDASVPLVVAIDDLQYLSHPHLLTSAQRSVRARAFGGICRRAARIVCSSRALRDAAVQHGGVLAERAVTVSPGALLAQRDPNPPAIAATLARCGLTESRFFLFVADFEPRHNHRLVLTALGIFRARHPASEIRLVCVGGPDVERASFKAIAEQMGLGAYVDFSGALASDDTSALVRGCRGVIVPALYETVGETVLEAMQLGRPVLCSQIPELTELTAGAALTFDAHRPADLAAAFERVEGDATVLDRLVQLGRERFTALDDAPRVAEAYLSACREF